MYYTFILPRFLANSKACTGYECIQHFFTMIKCTVSNANPWNAKVNADVNIEISSESLLIDISLLYNYQPW